MRFLKFILISTILLLSYNEVMAQSVKGIFTDIKDVRRYKFEADFSQASIHGLVECDFAVYEPEWNNDLSQVILKFTSSATEELSNYGVLISPNIESDYKMIWKVFSISKKGNVVSDVVIINCATGETIIQLSDINAKGGTFGSKMNLIGDGAIHAGEKLGKFMSKRFKYYKFQKQQ